MKNTKLLKSLPLFGISLLVTTTLLGNILFRTAMPSSIMGIILNLSVIVSIGFVIIPNLILFWFLTLNKPFRGNLLTDEVKTEERDEREQHISAVAGKRAFAAMHFTLLALLVLYLPLQYFSITLSVDLLNFLGNLGLSGAISVFYFSIPLIVGNYTYHHSLKEN